MARRPQTNRPAAGASKPRAGRPVSRSVPHPPRIPTPLKTPLKTQVVVQPTPGPLMSSLLPVIVDLYLRCEADWEHLDRIFSEDLRKHFLSGPGRGTVVKLIQGMIRHHGRLLGALGRLLDPGAEEPEPSRRLADMEPELRVRMLAAAYSIAEQEQDPAAVARLAGIRDVTLERALARLPEALAQATAVLDRAAQGIIPLDESLAAEGLSLPLWLTRLWAGERGWPETVALGRALLQPPPMTLRVVPHRMARSAAIQHLHDDLGLDAIPTPISPFGIILPERLPLDRIPLYAQGMLEVQDEGSQLVALAVNAAPGLRTLDICAGAGGKILLVASLQRLNGDPAETYATDPHRGRIDEMKKRLARAGLTHVNVRMADALDPHALVDLRGRLDRVLVDAPCSGLGALRRNPEAKWRLKPQDLDRFPALQVQLLEKAATLLRKGGRLIYSTCTLSRAENEEVLRLAAEKTGLQPSPVCEGLGSLSARLKVDPEQSMLELLPHRHGTDGFFLGVLRKP